MPVFDTLFRMSSNRIRLRKNTSSLSCLKGKSNSLETAYAQLFIFLACLSECLSVVSICFNFSLCTVNDF